MIDKPTLDAFLEKADKLCKESAKTHFYEDCVLTLFFMKYVSDNAYAWALAGQVPAKKSVLESEEYKALEPLRAFTEMAYRVDLGEIEFSNWYECYNGLGVAVSNAISGLMSPEEALNTAATEFLQWKAEEER